MSDSISLTYEGIEDALNRLDQKREDYLYYYIRPVYVQGGFNTFLHSFPHLQTDLSTILHFQPESTSPESKSDFVLVRINNNFGITVGTMEKKSEKHFKATLKSLRNFGVIPVDIPKLILYDVASNPFENYMLKEFRAGAEKQQSYFKDHRVPWSDARNMDKRLDQDRNMGLLPYRASFAVPTRGYKGKTVEVFANGLFVTTYLYQNFDFITRFLQRIVSEARPRFAESSKVRVEQNDWSRQFSVSADLEVNIETAFYNQQFDNFNNNAESLVEPIFQKIGRLSNVESREGAFHSVFLEESHNVSDIMAQYTVSVEEGKIGVTPVYSKHNLWYLTRLLHTIDNYFPIKEVTAV